MRIASQSATSIAKFAVNLEGVHRPAIQLAAMIGKNNVVAPIAANNVIAVFRPHYQRLGHEYYAIGHWFSGMPTHKSQTSRQAQRMRAREFKADSGAKLQLTLGGQRSRFMNSLVVQADGADRCNNVTLARALQHGMLFLQVAENW